MATEGRVSPVRSQCQCGVFTISSRTQCNYRKKAEQAIEGVLESIAPGNSSWLYQQVMQRRIRLCRSRYFNVIFRTEFSTIRALL